MGVGLEVGVVLGVGLAVAVGVEVAVGVAVAMAVGVGVGMGVGGTAKPLTRAIACDPSLNMENRKSPVTGSMQAPSIPLAPEMKFCMVPGIGSPWSSKEAVATPAYRICEISTLLAGNWGEPGGTKAIPLGAAADVGAEDA